MAGQASDISCVVHVHSTYSATPALDVEIAGRGVYRGEARIGGPMWLSSNPIHLR
jgi:hypothetical protein